MLKQSTFGFVLAIVSATCFAPTATAAPTYNLLTETDPGQATNNLVLGRYDTLTDLINLNPANTNLLPSLAGAVSARGLAVTFEPVPPPSVPEPTAIALLIIGLAGIGTVVRSRSQTKIS